MYVYVNWGFIIIRETSHYELQLSILKLILTVLAIICKFQHLLFRYFICKLDHHAGLLIQLLTYVVFSGANVLQR